MTVVPNQHCQLPDGEATGPLSRGIDANPQAGRRKYGAGLVIEAFFRVFLSGEFYYRYIGPYNSL
jgi:hypothetical protein